MPWLLLGFLELNGEKLAQFAFNILAIGGGFFVGRLFCGFLLWLLDRWITRGKTPVVLKQAWATIGGLAIAVLVALIVFGHGEGWTLMGGGGSGEENTNTKSSGTGTGPTTPTPIPSPPTDPGPITATPSTKPIPTTHTRIRVMLLGGDDVKDERFYLIDDDTTPRNFGDVRTTLTARKESSNQPIGIEVRFAEKNTLPPNHPAVLRLTQWAHSHGLTVTLPAGNP